MYDVIIIGGGPGGTAAGVYAARKKMNALLIASEFGGQSIVAGDIQNWIGEVSIAGTDLAKKLEEHVRAQEGLEIKMPEKVESVEKKEGGYIVKTDKGEYETKTVVVTSGARRRRLGVPGEEQFEGRGVVYCSTCDAPLFRDKTVVVVGGGNSGVEAAQDLIPYAKEIRLMEYGDALKADPVTVEQVKKSDKVKEIIFNAETKEVLGETLVSGIKYTDRESGEEKMLDVEGIFVEIGSVPNSEFVKGLVDLSDYGEIIVDHKTGETSAEGIFAAGDVTDAKYKQNNISAGDSIKAILSAHEYVLKHS
ncbi:FAD-dependent oxidoreductase [Patescibacteria group bacterium]|nr:FAD-dependent oxidoreductase [Patescibacteria group bacterium]